MILRRLLIVLTLPVVCLAAPGFAVGDDAAPPPTTAATADVPLPACGDPDVNTLAAVDCAGVEPVPSLDPADAANPPTVAEIETAAAAAAAAEPSPAELPAFCRLHANVYFYTSTDWLRLGQRLQANASPCADYYISIPPLAADKTALRCAQDDLIRALGPRFHPVAEFHFVGWNNWWRAAGKTPADAAHEFLKRVKACGYDFSRGETWSLNELHSGIRGNAVGARDNMRLLLNTLAAGLPDMPPSQGVVWVIGFGQNATNVSLYKPQLQEWFQDAAFWQDMARDVSVWGQETYPNMLFWGVADASRNERTRNLSLFLEHPLLLVEAGPPTANTARDFFDQTYVPLASAAWPWASGFGNTMFSADQMKRFIAEQTFAIKHFSQSRPHVAPDGRFAMAWAPNNTCTNPKPPPATVPCMDPKAFAGLTAGILERLASSIRESYELGGGSQAGACGPPGDHSWCSADIPAAAFNPLWETFPNW